MASCCCCFFVPNLPLSSSVASAATTKPRRALFNPNPWRLQIYPTIGFVGGGKTRRRVAARADPNVNSYALAFLLPFSLLAVTIFASIRIADKLDDDYFEELELNQAILEAEAEEGEDDDDVTAKPSEPPDSEPAAIPRDRNRPKRLA